MKISKIFFLAFLAGFLLFGFLYVRSCSQYEKEKAVWEAKVETLMLEIEELEQEVITHLVNADMWRDRAFEKTEELKKLERQFLEAERKHNKVLAGIAELAPDELVIRARYFLDVSESDIILTSQGVVFSIQAIQQLVTELTDYEFLIAEKVPSLMGQLDKKEEVLSDKNLEIGELRGAIGDLTIDRDKWKEAYEGEHRLRLSSEKRYNLFSTQNLITGGVVAVIVWGALQLLK